MGSRGGEYRVSDLTPCAASKSSTCPKRSVSPADGLLRGDKSGLVIGSRFVFAVLPAVTGKRAPELQRLPRPPQFGGRGSGIVSDFLGCGSDHFIIDLGEEACPESIAKVMLHPPIFT